MSCFCIFCLLNKNIMFEMFKSLRTDFYSYSLKSNSNMYVEVLMKSAVLEKNISEHGINV